MRALQKLPLNVVASNEVYLATSSSNFKVGVRAEEESVEILIHGAIGDSWQALDSGSVATFLKSNRGKTVNIDINSPGGLAFDGVSIYNALVMHDAPVNIDITGIAASAATIIAMAGDHIRIGASSPFAVHRAWGVAVGNQNEMLDVADFLNKVDEQLAATYAARTGRKAETMLKMMDAGTDGTKLIGQEAIDAGFANELIPLKKKPRDSGAKNEDDAVSKVAASVSELTGQFAAEAKQREADAVKVRLALLKLDEAV